MHISEKAVRFVSVKMGKSKRPFSKVEKVLRDGQVFIIRNGNTYDLTGRKQENSK